jgi:FAD synthetase
VEYKVGKNKTTTIMLFGTFDMIHPGHLHMFAQARKLAKKGTEPCLVVSLARDANVKRIKGKAPKLNEKKRLKQMQAIAEVDKAVLGAMKDYISAIIKVNPDVIALGYDQKAYVRGLRQALKAAGISPKIVRLKAHQPRKYKTHLLMN